MNKLLFVLILIAALIVAALFKLKAQDHRAFKAETFTFEGKSLPYRILYPDDFDTTKQYPLILFLHGAGERGSDNKSQLVHGGSFFADEKIRKEYPAVVVFPQCAAGSYWASVDITRHENKPPEFSFAPGATPTEPMFLTIQLLDSLLCKDWIDASQILIGGLSMGGMGTFELLYRRPEVFAAAFPICGGGNPDFINPEVKNVRVYAFHGEDDGVVSVEYSKKMIEAFVAAGVDARLTIYPGVGHNAWDYVFEEPQLLKLLFNK
jgi:predicted peptidase